MVEANKILLEWEMIFDGEKKKPNYYHSHICINKMSVYTEMLKTKWRLASFASILAFVILADYLNTVFITKV